MATATTTTTRTFGDSGPKHRACDECRTRKLACTKEADGCSRCKREGIACHYSPQKPMGRPRKRPLELSNAEIMDTAAPASKTVMMDIPPDTSDPGLAFINLLTTGDTSYDAGSQERGYSWAFGYAGDSLGDVGFDPVPQTTPSYTPTLIDPSLFISLNTNTKPPCVDQVPTLSPNSASTPESTQAGTPPQNSCAHTAALYLALDSMQHVPEGVEDAMRHARRATRTAYDVVNCPVCSFKLEPPDPMAMSSDVMRNFQNLMLLAALIPSIAHAYDRILRAVDEETRRATAERRRLVFKLRMLGGVLLDGGGCPMSGSRGREQQQQQQEDPCNAEGWLNHREMEPAMWRLAVRALLKADVYGLTGQDAASASGDLTPVLHIGLKDIVLQMEQRSKARHAVLDAMVLAGAWKPPPEGCGGVNVHPTNGETPTCQKIIAIAKAAIDNLVIA
ncbi:uncharacterized protein F4822DRAFT_434617 [Hypoxylon trugodes]|uniref:uncharacterized protein n=1 Tax=Hypoxylon trugodes TaxID=326681 RepID=UPI00219332F6|nr:uncharacterized protein F4822DRAFT_434617 [Hypoxylon trugodes]KAI1383503.1 hypothetical protein F4822DRAFT_434617 [Hypoxylon trugodes]